MRRFFRRHGLELAAGALALAVVASCIRMAGVMTGQWESDSCRT